MATTSKLEMSLDDIIKSNKSKEIQSRNIGAGRGGARKIIGAGRGGARKFPMAKKRIIGSPKGRQIGRPRISQQFKRKVIVPKRVIGGILRRKPMGIMNRSAVINARKNALQNKAVISATKTLVKKLVKKALNQPNIAGPVVMGRGKIRRVPMNRILQSRNILNKVSTRSRVIGRRPRIMVAQQPVVVQQVRGRGPVRFAVAGPSGLQNVSRRNFAPRGRFNNNVRYLKQQPTTVIVQQQQPQRNIPFQSVSVREHINALRRANNIQHLQAQYVNQPHQQSSGFLPHRRSPRQQQKFVTMRQQPQQQFVIQGRQPRRRRQQQPQQIVITTPVRQQRRPQQQFVGRQQFVSRGGRGRGGGRKQQQHIILDPMYVPPNMLQRI